MFIVTAYRIYGGRTKVRHVSCPEGLPSMYEVSSSALQPGRRLSRGPGLVGALFRPEGTKRVTSVNVQPPCLWKDLHTGSISRDVVNFPSELCRRRSGMFTEVAPLVPPGPPEANLPISGAATASRTLSAWSFEHRSRTPSGG